MKGRQEKGGIVEMVDRWGKDGEGKRGGRAFVIPAMIFLVFSSYVFRVSRLYTF